MSQNKYNSLDDVVFEERNKEYGAYDLRKSEGSILTKALIAGLILIILIVLGIYLFNVVNEITRKKDIQTVDITLMDVDEPEIIEEIIEEEEEEEEEVVEPEPEPEPEPEIAEVRVVMPDPRENVEVEEPIAKVEDMKDKVIGTVDREGDKATTVRGRSEPPVETSPQGTGQPQKPAVNYTARQVRDMAIYPGCERFAGNKNELQRCMSQKLQEVLGDELQSFIDQMASRGESSAGARASFVIDHKGQITQIKVDPAPGPRVNTDLAKETESALKRINDRLNRRGRGIQPAKLEDGSEVNLRFQLPVQFRLE